MKSYLIIIAVLNLFLAYGVENSIIPKIEYFECLENLNVKKYTNNQFLEIAKTLDSKGNKIRLVTYNVLFNLYDHNLDVENRWLQRLPRIVELLAEMDPDIFCVQELFPDQLQDLMPRIGHTYEFYSKPCADGELNGIFYKKDRFTLLDSHIWNMGPTLETLTMVQLNDKITNKDVYVFNAHLAFSNINKREFQARFIAEKLVAYSEKGGVIFSGDLNTFTQRLDLEKLPAFDGDYIHSILTKDGLRDAKEVAKLGHLGPISTFTNTAEGIIPFKGEGTPGIFLDHIYVSKHINVIIHAIQNGKVNGHYPSDHMPVLIDFLVQ